MAIILLYHRITISDSDPWALNVSPANFAGHLEVLKSTRRLVCVDDLVTGVSIGRSLDGRVAITFDDGYADNLYDALPLLEHFEVPATFYLTSTGFDGPGEFWWDELERLIIQPGVLPATLSLTI